ncbi:MAG: hypothetical protein ACO3UM_07585 [Planctomycetota bacterium]
MAARETERVRPSLPREGERGAALLLSLFFTIVTVGIVISGVLIEKSNREKTRTNFRLNSQANQFARAGLTEAISWYRRQTSQPVTQFAPVVDLDAEPPIIDTDDADVGIVREFRIEGKIWGRYEVWKQWAGDPDPARSEWREKMQAEDVSPSRSTGQGGTAWRLRSLGYVFERSDESLAFDTLPNRVVAVNLLEAEIVRRKLSPPGQAALTVSGAASINVSSYGRVQGGNTAAGIYFGTLGYKPRTRYGDVSGSPSLSQSPGPIDMSAEAVFGVSYGEFKGSADTYITEAQNIPSPIPSMSTVVIEMPEVIFDRDTPLSGTGIVYVKGNCTITAGSNSVFSGLLYVEGNLTMAAPAEIEGAVVVSGGLAISGSGDYATIRFSDEVLNSLRQQVGQYRFMGPFRPVHGGS